MPSMQENNFIQSSRYMVGTFKKELFLDITTLVPNYVYVYTYLMINLQIRSFLYCYLGIQ